MEKNIFSWIAVTLMWFLFVIYPAVTGSFNPIEQTITTLSMGGLTFYGFKYKE